jgi:hypothetical protein
VAVAEGTVPLSGVADGRVMIVASPMGLTSVDMEEKSPEEIDCTNALREGKRCKPFFGPCGKCDRGKTDGEREGEEDEVVQEGEEDEAVEEEKELFLSAALGDYDLLIIHQGICIYIPGYIPLYTRVYHLLYYREGRHSFSDLHKRRSG